MDRFVRPGLLCYGRAMRKFEVRHEMIVGADRFWELIHRGTDFLEALYVDYLDFQYEVLEDNQETGVRRTYITPKVDAPKAITKVMGDSISFTEKGQLTRTDAGPRYAFEVVPNKFANKISITGAMVTNPVGEDRCERVVEFNVECRVFGIGKLLEGFIQKEVERSYVQSAGITNDYLKKFV